MINYQYRKVIKNIIDQGRTYVDPRRSDQNVKRIQVPSYNLSHDLTQEFPAITTKKLAFKSVVGELLWFLRGDTNIKYLEDNGIKIWRKDAYNKYQKMMAYSGMKPVSMSKFIEYIKQEKEWHDIPGYKLGDLGPVYGHLWRHWQRFSLKDEHTQTYLKREDGIDQIQNIVESMTHMPMATTHIVNAWDPSLRIEQALEPCHFCFIVTMFPLTTKERAHFYRMNTGFREDTRDHKYFNEKGVPRYGFVFKWFQRSVDTFLGLPFNIASYGTLAHILGRLTNSVPMELKGDLSSVHLYNNSLEGVDEQLSRSFRRYKPGHLRFSGKAEKLFENYRNGVLSLDSVINTLSIDDITLPEYESFPALKVEMLARDQ
jgi:thymidylate synthase